MKCSLLSRSLKLVLSAALAFPAPAAAQIVVQGAQGLAPLPASPVLPAGFSLQTPEQIATAGLVVERGVLQLESIAKERAASAAKVEGRQAAQAGRKAGLAEVGREARGQGAARSKLDGLFDRILGRRSSPVEASERGSLGFRESEQRTEVNGFPLDPPPTLPENAPVQKVESYQFNLPAQPRQGVMGWFARVLGLQPEEDPPALEADPADKASVDRALKAYIGSNPQEFGGLKGGEVSNVYIETVKGQAGLTDTIYAHYIQSKDNLPVHDSYLTFTLKTVRGKLRVLSSRTRVFPNIEVPTKPSGRPEFTTDELLERAQARVGLPPQSADRLEAMGQAIKYIGGRWRALQVYAVPGHQFNVHVGVDLSDGAAYAWDPRVHSGRGGQVQGRGNRNGAWKSDRPLASMTLAHLKIEAEDGQVVYTDGEGRFALVGDPSKPVKVKGRLSGRFAHVENQTGDDLVFEGLVTPGQTFVAVFNPEGQDENKAALVNAYFHVTYVHDYLEARGVKKAELDVAIRVRANIDDSCNAYYTPGRPSLNFFSSSGQCSNTSFDSVAYHEYGHFVDDMIGGITNGGLSEAWGDILSMFIIGDPRIGVDFLKNEEVSWIRSGVNDYKYQRYDEVHKQGLAYMGYAWLIRLALDAAQGAAGIKLAEHLILPVFFAKARDIPQAAQEILLRDVDEQGNIPHLKILQAAAEHHGLTVKPPKGIAGVALRLAKLLTGWA